MYGSGIDVELVAVLRVDPLLHLHLLRRDCVPLGQRRSELRCELLRVAVQALEHVGLLRCTRVRFLP
jgi:hypothetical protein